MPDHQDRRHHGGRNTRRIVPVRHPLVVTLPGSDESLLVHLLLDLGASATRAPLYEDVRCEPPSLVFVDLGERHDLLHSAVRFVREKAVLSGIPIVVAVHPEHALQLDPRSGYDDFIVMPCTPTELYARMRLAEWKVSEFSHEERLKAGAVVVDVASREVACAGRRVPLTAKEFELLRVLLEERGRVLSRETLLRRVWGDDYEGGTRTVDVHVTRLRKKLAAPELIVTHRAAGYTIRKGEPA